MVNLATQLGGSIAVALLDVVVDRRMTFHSEVLGGAATLSRPPIVQFLQHSTLQELAQLVGTQALVLAYADATWVMMLIAIVCTPLVLLMRKPKARQAPVEIGG
jgi:DHA2 family multidrug resistance protein